MTKLQKLRDWLSGQHNEWPERFDIERKDLEEDYQVMWKAMEAFLIYLEEEVQWVTSIEVNPVRPQGHVPLSVTLNTLQAPIVLHFIVDDEDEEYSHQLRVYLTKIGAFSFPSQVEPSWNIYNFHNWKGVHLYMKNQKTRDGLQKVIHATAMGWALTRGV